MESIEQKNYWLIPNSIELNVKKSENMHSTRGWAIFVKQI